MKHLLTVIAVLACLGVGAFLLPLSSQTATQPQPQELKDAVKRFQDLTTKLAARSAPDEATKGGPAEELKQLRRRLAEVEADHRELLALFKIVKPMPPKEAQVPTMHEKNLAAFKMLQQSIDTKGLAEKIRLRTALKHLSDLTGGKLTFLVDRDAFANTTPDAPDPHEEIVSLPDVPRQMMLSDVLQRILQQVGQRRGAFVIRRGYVEIIPGSFSGGIVASFDQQSVQTVLQELAADCGACIYLDPNVAAKAQTRISATFCNVDFGGALFAVTEMAGLKIVAYGIEGPYFVTTAARAKVLQKEMRKNQYLGTPPRMNPKVAEAAK